MDSETLDLLLDQVSTQWARPLDDYELTAWRRNMAPEVGESLDPEFVAEAVLLAKHSPAFEHIRPDLAAFRGFYNRVEQAHQPPVIPFDPEDIEASPETTRTALELCRSALAAASAARAGLDEARSQLLHEMVRADTNQGSLL